MSKRYFRWIVPAGLSLMVSTGASAQTELFKRGLETSAEQKSEQGLERGEALAGDAAQNQGLKKGPEISAERKSEQGLEHGKAYAGTREEERDAELDDDEEKINKAKKEKAEKKMKKEKGRKGNIVKQEQEKIKKQKD